MSSLLQSLPKTIHTSIVLSIILFLGLFFSGEMAFDQIFWSWLFRYFHVLSGVMWIGLLYFYNFINGHVVATMDGDTKKKILPELMPRTLYWFRWGAAWTWFTGIILLYIIFWSGSLSMGATSESSMMVGGEGVVNMWSHIMLLVTFLAVFVYEGFEI